MSLLHRLLPQPADRRVATWTAFLAVGSLLPLLLAGVAGGGTTAQLTWMFGAGPWPYATDGEPVRVKTLFEDRWFRTDRTKLPLDPWGHPYYLGDLGNDATVMSAGPNGEFEGGVGDDVQVAGFFFYGGGFLVVLLALGGVFSSLLGAFLWVVKRQAAMARSERLGVEVARSALIALPILCAASCLLFGSGLGFVAESATGLAPSFGLVPPWLAVLGSAALVVTLGVLGVRLGRPAAAPRSEP